MKLGKVTTSNVSSHLLNILTTPELLAGLTCYGLGAFAYILLLTRVKLSIAGPAVALVYVFSVLVGYFLFRESVPFSRVVGFGADYVWCRLGHLEKLGKYYLGEISIKSPDF